MITRRGFLEMGAADGAAPAVKGQLLLALGARGVRAAVPVALQALAGSDGGVRAAAAKALAQTADDADLPAVVQALAAATGDDDRRVIEEAISGVCHRVGQRCADPLMAVMPAASEAVRAALIRCLAPTGSSKALSMVRGLVAAAAAAGVVRDEAVRALSNWRDDAARADLLALARSAFERKHQVLGLRGYVRLTVDSKDTDEAKLKALAEAMTLAERPEEIKLVLGGVGGVECPEALQFAMKYLQAEGVGDEAAAAAVRIAEGLREPEHRKLVRSRMQQVSRAAVAEAIRQAARKLMSR